MVKISFASIFFLLATLSSLSFTFPIQPRSVIKLEADLNQLSVDVAELASLIGSIVNGLDVVDETVSGKPIRTPYMFMYFPGSFSPSPTCRTRPH
jgi:hypothetical protein